MGLPLPAKRRRMLSPCTMLRELPTALLHLVCSYLQAFGIDALSTCDHFLRTECVKPGAWRGVHIPFETYPSNNWLRTRLARSAVARQLKHVSMAANFQRYCTLVEHTTLETLRLHYNPGGGRALCGLASLPRLRELRVNGGAFVCVNKPLPASIEILEGKVGGSLESLVCCPRLRVLDLGCIAARDLSVLPRLSSLRDLTVSHVQPRQLHYVAQCHQLVALRVKKPTPGEIRTLLGLPQGGLRTLCISHCGEQEEVIEVVRHFTALQTVGLHFSCRTGVDMSAVTSTSLLRLNLMYPWDARSSWGMDHVDGLRACLSLREFYAPSHQIKNIDGLLLCGELRVLDIRSTFLNSLEHLVLKCPKLQIVAIHTHGHKLRPLRSLQSICTLDVSVCVDLQKRHLLGMSPTLRRILVARNVFDDMELSFLHGALGFPVDVSRQTSYWDESRSLAS